jgi:hypothetical protein
MRAGRVHEKQRQGSTAQLDLPLEDLGGFSFVVNLAGFSLSCFVSRLALVERAGVRPYRGLPVGTDEVAAFFEAYRAEIEDVAVANFRAGRCGGGEHDVLVMDKDLNQTRRPSLPDAKAAGTFVQPTPPDLATCGSGGTSCPG